MHVPVLPIVSISLAVAAIVATSVMWSLGRATFDSLSFITGCIASALLFAGHHLSTHPGAHP